MCRRFHRLLCLLVIAIVRWAASTNYDNYIERLARENQELHSEFLRSNPRGKYVLDRLNSPDYVRSHPVLGESSDDLHEIRPRDWRAFLRELESAKEEASQPFEEDGMMQVPTSRWYRPESQVSADDAEGYPITHEPTARRNEVAYQNPLWGEHKVSGGSGEIGQWLDYALMGAELQDADDESPGGIQPESAADVLGRVLDSNMEIESKNDSLPAYCDPPNPCPIGYDPDSLSTPCDTHIEPTMKFNQEWILSKQASGECTCDKEHMYACPSDNREFQHHPSNMYFPDKLLHVHKYNPYLRGLRRKRLVAKKAVTSKDSSPYYYWQGKVTKRVVKKAGDQAA